MTAYQTIASVSEASYIEKKSEFIAQLAPVQTPEAAVNFIESVRKQHRKAKHHVYAYCLQKDHISRYSDDGEPQGSAGTPVLNILQKRELTDICCVVTRYFGGILLGANGLVRAYSQAASLAAEKAKIQVMCPCFPVTLKMDYTQYGKISYDLPKEYVILSDTIFTEQVEMRLFIKATYYEQIKKKWIDRTGNQIDIQTGKLQYTDFSESFEV